MGLGGMVYVRVRGIYSTAVSKILHDEGFKLVEASEKIRERLGIEFDTSPCDVTVKDTENPDELLIVGFPKEAKSVVDSIVSKLVYVYKWEAKPELHSVYLGVVVEKHGDQCIVDIGEARGVLIPCKEGEGSRVIVGVKHPVLKPGENLVLTKNFRIVGKRVALIHGESKVSFSEHIREPEVKARLSAIAASKLMGSGVGVHFRSSSRYASVEEIANEINSLVEEYKGILSRVEGFREPLKIRDGEFLGIIGLTSLAKSKLDEIRRSVSFTIDYHHSLKSMGYSDLVDFAEDVLTPILNGRGENTGLGVLNYIYKSIRSADRVDIYHIKPTGEVLKLQPGRVLKAEFNSSELLIILERHMRSPGVYDGLGIEKKAGDVDYMVVKTGSPYVVHNYYRGGNWLGTYININTPPEISSTIVKYHDLLIDIAITPPNEVKIIDAEELESLYQRGSITKELYEYAVKAVREVAANPLDYVYNPARNQLKKDAGVPEPGQRGRVEDPVA